MADFYTEAAQKRVEKDRRKKEIAKLKRIVEQCQRKLEAVTDPKYTPLSANGDQLLLAEIRENEARIKTLSAVEGVGGHANRNGNDSSGGAVMEEAKQEERLRFDERLFVRSMEMSCWNQVYAAALRAYFNSRNISAICACVADEAVLEFRKRL